MLIVDYRKVSQQSILKKVRANHWQSGISLIRNFPLENRKLKAFALQLGLPSKCSLEKANTNKKIVESGFIHRVEAEKYPPVNSSGSIVISRSNRSFALHTDEYFAPDPSDMLVMVCYRGCPLNGGATLVCKVKNIVGHLSQRCLSELAKPQFQHPCGLVPVLQRFGQLWFVRFNPYDLADLSRLANRPNVSRIACLNKFGAVALQKSQRLHLKRGDCIILNNWTNLHGREAFASTSDRLLKRVRIRSI
jgi:hypothetical protein